MNHQDQTLRGTAHVSLSEDANSDADLNASERSSLLVPTMPPPPQRDRQSHPPPSRSLALTSKSRPPQTPAPLAGEPRSAAPLWQRPSGKQKAYSAAWANPISVQHRRSRTPPKRYPYRSTGASYRGQVLPDSARSCKSAVADQNRDGSEGESKKDSRRSAAAGRSGDINYGYDSGCDDDRWQPPSVDDDDSDEPFTLELGTTSRLNLTLR